MYRHRKDCAGSCSLTAGADLSGWSIVAYNGNGGVVYKTTNLFGSIPNQQNGFGTLSFNISSLQNGKDGMVLVNSDGSVIQFLSYEGSFTATDGSASGMTSTNVGVSETSSTPVGHSLQLTGNNKSYDDFTWPSSASNIAGAVNKGQSF